MELEIQKLGITVNDNSLRNILKNDKSFSKDKKFSRTEYEKFLIKSGITAPQFEANIVEQEKRRQFLSSLAGGIVIPEILVEKEFNKFQNNNPKTLYPNGWNELGPLTVDSITGHYSPGLGRIEDFYVNPLDVLAILNQLSIY